VAQYRDEWFSETGTDNMLLCVIAMRSARVELLMHYVKCVIICRHELPIVLVLHVEYLP